MKTVSKDMMSSGSGWKRTKITKRAKSVDVIVHEYVVTERVSSYVCPSCHKEYKGFGPNRRATRFLCECGQELIVRKRTTVKD